MDRAAQIEMIRSHIAQGERHGASQRAVVARLRRLGADTLLAEELLEEFELTLAEHQRHLDQLVPPQN